MTRIIGIDPGLKGGIVELTNGQVTNRMPMPLARGGGIEFGRVLAFLRERCPNHVFIERQQPMRRNNRKQGVSSTFKTGRNFGFLEGLCMGALLPCTTIPPQTWQKSLMFPQLEDSKANSVATAKTRWPDIDWKRNKRCKKDHDGMTDAANIAWYALWNITNKVAP